MQKHKRTGFEKEARERVREAQETIKAVDSELLFIESERAAVLARLAQLEMDREAKLRELEES